MGENLCISGVYDEYRQGASNINAYFHVSLVHVGVCSVVHIG